MDEINTNPTPLPTDELIIGDSTIEEMNPTLDGIPLEKEPMSEAQAEVEVGGDEPVEEGHENFNEEDEEAEKQESIS